MIPRVYLPIVVKDYPPMKVKSGVHLGTRETDWSNASLARLKGTSQGAWPAAVVVLSNNLYTIDRNTPNCTVSGVSIRSQTAFDYLKAASQAGAKVIIRIEPSPGNFKDALDPALAHDLLYDPGQTPENSDYCSSRFTQFRAVDDIAREMKFIHDRNLSLGWQEFGFEPANEPNLQWYSQANNGDTWVQSSAAWLYMDLYFMSLYNYVHANYANIHVLTPPMAQYDFAEDRNFTACDFVDVTSDDTQAYSGYELMPNTYGDKNDGFTWHNYWRLSNEAWETNFCPKETDLSNADHVFQYFPPAMQSAILSSGKPAFITEADLYSSCPQNPPHPTPIPDKDMLNGTTAADSLQRFIAAEQVADYVIAWLLTTGYSDTAGCTGSYEHAWHEAYQDSGLERVWFREWWLRNEP